MALCQRLLALTDFDEPAWLIATPQAIRDTFHARFETGLMLDERPIVSLKEILRAWDELLRLRPFDEAFCIKKNLDWTQIGVSHCSLPSAPHPSRCAWRGAILRSGIGPARRRARPDSFLL